MIRKAVISNFEVKVICVSNEKCLNFYHEVGFLVQFFTVTELCFFSNGSAAFIKMYANTDDTFTLTIIYTCLFAYPLSTIGINPYKTHFYTFRQVYEHKLWADNLANTDV